MPRPASVSEETPLRQCEDVSEIGDMEDSEGMAERKDLSLKRVKVRQ